jgi:hypothetical protein
VGELTLESTYPAADLTELSCESLKAPVDRVEAAVNRVEPPIDRVETLIDVGHGVRHSFISPQSSLHRDCKSLAKRSRPGDPCYEGDVKPQPLVADIANLTDRKRLRLKRDDSCVQCARALPAGTEAFWLRAERHVICLACGETPPKAPVSAPGASARRIHEQRRQAREQRQRQRYGRIGGWAARRSSGPQHERAWARGAAGEETNARRLEKRLADKSAVLLHDRRLPNSRANIDHLGVGPGGVTVIDSKNLTGKVRIDWKGGLFSPRRFDLYVNGRRRTTLVESVENQVAAVRAVLADEGFTDLSVVGALCMTDPQGLPLLKHLKIRDVVIEGTRYVAKVVARDGELEPGAIQTIAAALDRRLPPA